MLMPRAHKSVLALAALATLFIAQNSQAQAGEVYSCVFTEPFFNFSYNSDTKELSKVGDQDFKELPDGTTQTVPRIETGIELIENSGFLLLANAAGVLQYTLELTGNASDGMSDIVYPFEAVAVDTPDLGKGFVGACESTSKPATPAPIDTPPQDPPQADPTLPMHDVWVPKN